MNRQHVVSDYLRPLKLSIAVSVLGEAIIFMVWGVVLYPEGNLLHKFLWAIVYCGFGMGSAAGAVIALLVVGRLNGPLAIIATMLVSILLLGLFCNFLCLNLDMHFGFFGGADIPSLFIWNGIILSAAGGWLVGWLCFTTSGAKLGKRLTG